MNNAEPRRQTCRNLDKGTTSVAYNPNLNNLGGRMCRSQPVPAGTGRGENQLRVIRQRFRTWRPCRNAACSNRIGRTSACQNTDRKRRYNNRTAWEETDGRRSKACFARPIVRSPRPIQRRCRKLIPIAQAIKTSEVEILIATLEASSFTRVTTISIRGPAK